MRMTQDDIRKAIEDVVQKLPDLVRADLASRDPLVRQGAEEVVATKIMLALDELSATS